jgi:malonyl CoA-acyl carrier protein transacylase
MIAFFGTTTRDNAERTEAVRNKLKSAVSVGNRSFVVSGTPNGLGDQYQSEIVARILLENRKALTFHLCEVLGLKVR